MVERERDYFRDKNTKMQKELREASRVASNKRADSEKNRERKKAGTLQSPHSPDRGLVNLQITTEGAKRPSVFE